MFWPWASFAGVAYNIHANRPVEVAAATGIRRITCRAIYGAGTMVSKTARPQIPFDGDEVDDLTIEYPSSDGEPMAENDWQYIAITDTVHALRFRYRHREDVYVAGDMMMYYRMNRPDLSVAPDVYAVIGAEGNHRRDSWIVWREGRSPDFVMEIASPSTWRRDAGEKRDIYAAMGVAEYWRFDPTGGDFFTPTLVGERLVDGRYRQLASSADSEARQRIRSIVLELDFCVLDDGELRLHDPETGEWLRTPREDGEGRLIAEAALREAEAENAQLREELRRLQRQR